MALGFYLFIYHAINWIMILVISASWFFATQIN